MALDSNLFTLSFMRRTKSPSIVDLYSLSPSHLRSLSNGTPDLPTSEKGIPPLYTRHRALNSPIYDSLILDGLVETPLSSLTASNTAEKKKEVKLHDPDGSAWLEKKGNTFHQDWTFEWESETFYWRKESSVGGKNQYNCFASRKPDPSISVAIYRPSNKSRPALLQVFDHNLSRFDLVDKRGLEVLFIHTLFSLLDLEYDERIGKDGTNMYISNVSGSGSNSSISKTGSLGRRPPTNQGQGNGNQLLQSSSPNEIPISSHGDPSSYVSHAISLLRCDADPKSAESSGSAQNSNLLLIILKANSSETSAKAIKIASEIKNAYYRLPQAAKGKESGEDLFMYVREDENALKEAEEKKGDEGGGRRPRIKLDGSSSSSPTAPPTSERKPYQPPSALSIYLSKSRLHEFEAKPNQPRIPPKTIPPSSGNFPNPRNSNPLAPASRPWITNSNSNSSNSSFTSPPSSVPLASNGSSSSLGTGAKLLGKLGIGKNREGSEEGKK